MRRDVGIAKPPIQALGTPQEEAALAEVSARSVELSSVVRVVVFGSRVRGDFRGDSDLDLLFIVRDISSRDEVIRLLSEIEENSNVTFAPVGPGAADPRRLQAVVGGKVAAGSSIGAVGQGGILRVEGMGNWAAIWTARI